jgi:3-oxoacyl-[acyl-carrier-protein] synthase-3
VDYNRTGLKKEGLKDEDKGTSYLAIKAAQDLFLKQMLILRIDMIIMATATPDMPVASQVYVATIGATACL